MFTRDQIEEIKSKLIMLGTKDTQFPDAHKLNGEEIIAIVQDGENKKIPLSSIINDDFINVSKDITEILTLSTAVSKIDINNRKLGQVITFKDSANSWAIRQFTGSSLDNWNDISLWKSISGIDELKSQVESNAEDISVLSDEIERHDASILNLNTDVSKLKDKDIETSSSLSELNTKVDTLKSQADTNTNNISSLNTEVSTLQGKVDVNTTSISQINNNIADHEKSIAQINTILDEHTESINAKITTDRIEDGAVTSEKIATSAVDDNPIAGSNNLVKSGGVYNLNKKLDIIKGVDNTDLTNGYYYDNTNGNKIVNINSYSTLIDIPSGTKEITLNWVSPSINTSGVYGIALYDAYVSELTDENISSHFINGFNEKKLLEVPRIVIDSRYKSIAISSDSHRTIQFIFNPKVSYVKYGSRLIDVFYLNDSSTRSLKGKSLFLRTLDKSTGTISFRDSNSLDYNLFSTKKEGKELLIGVRSNYVYLGVLVDWDIVDYDFTNVPQSEENTIVLSTPKSSEGQRIFDMFFNKKYRQTGNTTKNEDGVISEYDCVWEDGTAGHVKYNTYDANVLEYRSSIVTYGSNYDVHYGLKTFDEFGNVISETGLEIRNN